MFQIIMWYTTHVAEKAINSKQSHPMEILFGDIGLVDMLGPCMTETSIRNRLGILSPPNCTHARIWLPT